ncbi:MAG: serine/threonine-protein kinase [Myxococcota bacterium]
MPHRILYGDYHLLGRLNTGGMAEVFLGRRVDASPESELLAVKRMLPRYSEDMEFSTMFQDEARIASRLDHPNICRVFDQGEHDEQLFIVMEFVHGKDMKVVHARATERGEQIPYTIVAFVLANMADALDHAHNLRNEDGDFENLVHRDVSPQNILVSYDGVPKLIDFGVARAKSRISQTKVGIVKGKFAYMSPEQAMAKPLDGRSDVWALGVCFYQLLTGELPFRGTSDLDTLRKIASGQSVPITEVAPNTPNPIVDIISRAMQPNPDDRFQRAGDFAKACRAFAARSTRTVDSNLLASYMRRLFQREYQREINRIRKYREGEDAASLRRARARATLDHETLSLAAGYESKPGDDDIIAEVEVDEPTGAMDDAGFEELTTGDVLLIAHEESDGEGVDLTEHAEMNPFEHDALTDETPKPTLEPPVEEPAIELSFNEPTVQTAFPNAQSLPRGDESETVSMMLPSDFRRVWLNRSQVSWLFVALLVSATVLAGTYYYALTVPLPGVTD